MNLEESISCGQTINDTITSSGAVSSYVYNGASGQALSFALEGFGDCFYEDEEQVLADVYDPDGKLLATIGGACGPQATNVTLALSGTFTILVHDSSYEFTGDYGLSVQAVTGGGCDSTAIVSGQTVASQITLAGEQSACFYSGTAGQLLSFALEGFGDCFYEDEEQVLADIYDPDEKLLVTLGGACGPQTTNLTLGLDGIYTILVHDSFYEFTGDYSLSVQIVGQSSVPQIAINQPSNGATFTAPANVLIQAVASNADNTPANVSFYANTNYLGSASNAPFQLVWSNVSEGDYLLTAVAVDGHGMMATSLPVSITVAALSSTNLPVFAFASSNYSVNEYGYSVTLTVVNGGDLGGIVNYQTVNGTAFGGNGIGGDYTTTVSNINFNSGHSSNSISIPIMDNYLNGPSLQFQVQLFDPGSGILGNPAAATVTIIRDDPGAATNALLAQAPASFPLPGMNGQLTVFLPPTNSGGQWRFPWEFAWRNSGDTAGNLVAGDYPILFRRVPGWLAIPLTNSLIVANGETTVVTNQYYPTVLIGSAAVGSLTVDITPASLGGTGWRFFGETTWRAGGSTAANLLPDVYDVEFEPVSGYVKPMSLAVLVTNGINVLATVNYTNAPTATNLTPEPVLPGDYANSPYVFCGQLQTDVGFGSGMAVRNNVVLTAAHMVFNDSTLNYVTNAWWSFQEEAGVFQPEPLAARGWCLLSGYAAQRTTDVLTNHISPGESSSASRNLDVAALYFLTDVARSGFSGYLSSDEVPNPYLSGSSLKTLVGYPVDGSMFGQVVMPGAMYATPLDTSAFDQATDQVYTASWLYSYPGDSGGPLCAQYTNNGRFYPVAVYLGTLYDSIGQPYATAVRAIDSNAFNLINVAATEGDYGTNNEGGGVVTFIPIGVNSSHPAVLILHLEPPAAVVAGAAWKFTNQPAGDYLSATTSTQELISTNAVGLQFLPISDWNVPTNQTVTLTQGTTSNTSYYTVAVSWATPTPISYGTALSSNQLNATVPAITDGTSGIYAYNPTYGSILPVGTHALSVTFTPSNTTQYGGSSTTNVSLVVLPSASPVIQPVRQSGNSFTFTWSTISNQMYQIQSTTNLAKGNWTDLGGVITATNSTETASYSISNSQKFYRVVFLP